VLSAHWELKGAGIVLAQAVAPEAALAHEEFEAALARALDLAAAANVRGPAVTPFLLARLAEITEGKTLRTNQALVVANARLAAQVARELRK
jgi:pseudouridine-5'-phosphate glycosidase